MAKLANDGWSVSLYSMAEAVESVLRKNKMRKLWLKSKGEILSQIEEQRGVVDFREINKTLSAALVEGKNYRTSSNRGWSRRSR